MSANQALLKKLISQANAIIDSTADNTIVLGEYLQNLEKLDSFGTDAANKSLKPLFIELVSLHQAVIQKIEEEKATVKSRLSTLRRKAKVAIKYTDHLPKSISLKTRKKI